jgi:uncharacterized membrane protein
MLKLFPGRKAILQSVIFIAVTAIFLTCLFFFNQIEKTPLVNTDGRTFEKAKVVAIVKDNLAADGNRYGNQVLKLQMLTGKLKGQIVDATSDNGYLFGAACRQGMRVIVIASISGNTNVITVYSVDRSPAVYGFIALFLLALWLIGGKNGFKSAFALVFTFICILFLYLPLLYQGFSPFLAAVLVVVVTTVVSMCLIGGFTRKTLAAILGTVGGVVVAGFFAAGFGYFAGISGFNVSDIESLLFVGQMTHIQVGGLLFSGILIASLGAVMDVGISISSTVNEIYANNPALTTKELFRSGMNVGRDMIGTMSNTLILAFTGGSISILVLDYAYNLPYLQIINAYSTGIEIMQGISGSLGVILTVPFVSFIAAQIMPEAKKQKTGTDT